MRRGKQRKGDDHKIPSVFSEWMSLVQLYYLLSVCVASINLTVQPLGLLYTLGNTLFRTLSLEGRVTVRQYQFGDAFLGYGAFSCPTVYDRKII